MVDIIITQFITAIRTCENDGLTSDEEFRGGCVSWSHFHRHRLCCACRSVGLVIDVVLLACQRSTFRRYVGALATFHPTVQKMIDRQLVS